MRVYCAYSLSAVVLLFGGSNWERDGLKKCFMDLVGNPAAAPDEDKADGAVGSSAPPLPVKRCLASSVHAIAHMLGLAAVAADGSFLPSFERAFLQDPDEAIRLNILKNLGSFLGALPPSSRDAYLPVLAGIIMSENVLGAARKRSASNPGVLNWRQRDAVARVLPDLIVLFDANLNREHMWPILQLLLHDSVSAVRENAGWSVPVLLRRYINDSSKLAPWASEVVAWLRETFLDEGGVKPETCPKRSSSLRRLKKQMVASEGAFSKRQGYCRILATVSLTMRIGEETDAAPSDFEQHQPDSVLGIPSIPIDPFGKLSANERAEFRSILLDELLPPALEMAADCVANVRLILTKCLKVLPEDVKREGRVTEVLSTLVEELQTWDVGMGGVPNGATPGIMGVSDPPEKSVGGVMMTSTMSAC